MKYVLEWCVRPGVGGQQGEADTRRAYELYSKGQPRVRILQFVGRIDAEGGFMVWEADNPPTSGKAQRSWRTMSSTSATRSSTLTTGYRPVWRASASATALADPEQKTPPR